MRASEILAGLAELLGRLDSESNSQQPSVSGFIECRYHDNCQY